MMMHDLHSLVCMQIDARRGADFELCDHVISFMNVVLKSPEAEANAQLQKRFVDTLLTKGVPLD